MRIRRGVVLAAAPALPALAANPRPVSFSHGVTTFSGPVRATALVRRIAPPTMGWRAESPAARRAPLGGVTCHH